MEEPSVLDYLKSRLNPWNKNKIEIPPALAASEVLPGGEPTLEGAQASFQHPVVVSPTISPAPDLAQAPPSPAAGPEPVWEPAPAQEASAALSRSRLPWRSLLGLGLALAAQLSLEPGPQRGWLLGAILYTSAVGFAILAAWRGEWQLGVSPQPPPRAFSFELSVPGPAGNVLLFVVTVFCLVAFAMFGGNRFTQENVAFWLAGLALLLALLWQRRPTPAGWISRIIQQLRKGAWSLTVNPWRLLVLGAIAIVVFFRVYRLEQVPPEMVSDHAEKLLDIYELIEGNTRIFFERNTGREALQMYLTAAIIQLFNTGYTHLSLKIGTVLAGLLALPYLFLLGKEIANRRVGLLAFVLAGIAYWPNVISRVGLRFPFYPLFVAPVLYYLVRGLRTMNRNDFLLAGLFLGIGLHGYTPIRILPFLIVAAIILFWLHTRQGSHRQVLVGLSLIALVSLLVFLPLLRYSLENPELFAYRSFTRLGSIEQPLPGPAWQLFLGNLWRALTMFAWDDGEIWVNSVTHRPALDVVTAALFYLGVALVAFRYVRRRNWLDIFLLFSVPMLLMPSILSLAFPAENPALNRMAGAIVPVFILAALALDSLLSALQKGLSGWSGPASAAVIAGFLLFWSANQNYDLVFNQYQQVFRLSSWNTSEMGRVIKDFAGSFGAPDTAWVVAFPHWVDTRLVGMHAGFPTRDYAIWPENLASTQSEPRAKLFLIKPEDEAGQQALREIYPLGVLQTYSSKVEGHDFYIYFVPASTD